MTPVEKLEAALRKLEAQREAADRGPLWDAGVCVMVGGDYLVANDHLVETLHRTIDAQLAILKADLAFLNEQAESGWSGAQLDSWATEEVVALADAILGDQS